MKYLLLGLTIASGLSVHAQTKKGERLVKEGRFQDALKPLKKAFEGDNDDRKAGVLLMESYYTLQRYQEALDVAELMNAEASIDENETILFTDVLIANNDFSRAYINLARALGEGGVNVQGYKWLNKTANLLQWDTIVSENEVTDVSGLNTVYNEYAPSVMEEGLMYIGDQFTVQTLYPTAFTNQSLHLLFTSKELSQDNYVKPKLFLRDRDYYFHDGPIEEVPNEDGLYAITLREIEGLLYDLKMNIYFSELTGKESDIKPFKYNGTSNTGHPTFTKNGTRMYFASDRPGGYGQLDIWYSDWENGGWTNPMNAGPSVNSEKNELYPKVSNDRLFFSSDRRDQGYGGLDLYYISLVGENKFAYNLRAPINSPYDDFAVTFSDSKNGYFSSNRPTGFGGDDIYAMHFQPSNMVLDTVSFALEDSRGKKKLIKIYDYAGNEVIGVDEPNKNKTMVGLLTRELYTIRTDSVFDTSLKLIARDSRGHVVREFESSEPEFNIEFLEQDYYSFAAQDNRDDSELLDLSADLVGEEALNFKELTFEMQDINGEPLNLRVYDSNGQELLGVQDDENVTTLSGIKTREVYMVKTNSLWEEEITLVAKSTNGEVVKEFTSSSSSFEIEFLEQDYYRVLKQENEDNSHLLAISDQRNNASTQVIDPLNLIMKDRQGKALNIRLFDDEGNELNPSHDAYGKTVEGIIPGVKYKVRTDSTWSNQINLTAYDQQGEKVEEFVSTQSEFTIEFLKQEEYDLNKQENEDEGELFDLVADYGGTIIKDTLTFQATDSSGKTLNMSLFDSKGKEIFGFDDSKVATGLDAKEVYTARVDESFNEEVKLVAYTESGEKLKEINANKSSFRFQFIEQEDYSLEQESNQDNNLLFDLNGVVSSDQFEDFSQVAVVLKDENGDELNEINTDHEGNFEFKNLSTEKEYYLSMLGLTGAGEIDVVGETGAPLETLKSASGGNSFAYTRSRPEAAWMMTTSVELPMVFAIVPTAEIPETETPDLYALGDSLVRACQVDEDGFIKLGSLITGHAYELRFNRSTFNPLDRLVILDGYGDTTQTVRPDENAAFVFELMPPSAKLTKDEPELVQINEVDNSRERVTIIPAKESEPAESENEREIKMNLFGNASGLSQGDPIVVYDSNKELLLETFALSNGSFAINQIEVDSIFYIDANSAAKIKLTSAFHGFDREGVKQANGWWKFDFTKVEEMEKVVTLANVYYRFDSYTLSPESKEALNELYSYLVQNPSQKIKVLSHTDCRGPRAYNEMLSNNRAREVVRYLIRRGIDENRLAYEGRGESQPVNDCKDGVWCPNSKHAANRRTEFVLVKN